MLALLLAEPWEAALAVASVRAVLRRRPGLHVLAPEFLVPHLADPPDLARAALVVEAVAMPPGFPTLDRVHAALLAQAGDRPSWWLPAGSLPADSPPASGPPDEEADDDMLPVLRPPVHAPPSPRLHRCERVGHATVWRLDTGEGYFAALCGMAGHPATPAWQQYGPAAPVFAVNTSRFEPVPTPAADRYFILGSGLIGLRAVLESDPRDGAEIVVFDINPAQLDWVRHVLEHAALEPTLPGLVSSFQAMNPPARVRPVAPHEQANMELQAEWFATARHAIAALSTRLRWTMTIMDLWTAPQALLRLMEPPVDRTFFCYLDLFQVWHREDAEPWIADMPDLARGLRRLVRDHAGGEVMFYPAEPDGLVDIAPGNPLLEGMT